MEKRLENLSIKNKICHIDGMRMFMLVWTDVHLNENVYRPEYSSWCEKAFSVILDTFWHYFLERPNEHFGF